MWGCPIIFLFLNAQVVTCIVFVTAILIYGLKFSKDLILVLLSLFISYCYVWIHFDHNQYISYSGRAIVILIAYTIVRGDQSFVNNFIKVIRLISIVALIIYLSDLLFGFAAFIDTSFIGWNKHVVIHNFTLDQEQENDFFYRNSSFFWEPGAFAAHILLALFFLIFKNGVTDKVSIMILSLALLSTQSTMGITVLLFLIIGYLFTVRNYRLLLLMTFFIFGSLFFLDPNILIDTKAISQFVELSDVDFEIDLARGLYSSRLGNVFLMWDSFKSSPFFGSGLITEIKLGSFSYLLHDVQFIGIGNGLMDLLSSFGLIFFGLWGWLVYHRISGFFDDKSRGVVFFLILLSILFSEPIHNLPVFYFFAFLIKKN